MNKTSVSCYSHSIDASYFTYRHLAALTVLNLIVMVGNVIANGLVIHILIKTKQLSNVACKLIFMLSISDLMIGTFAQNLFFAVMYGTNCFVQILTRTVSVFFTNLSSYTISLMGIDRFIRIKYYANFRAILKNKFIFTLISLVCLAALFNGIGFPISLLLKKEHIFSRVSFYSATLAFIIVTFMQVLLIRTSKVISRDSSVDASRATTKKITTLSIRILFAKYFLSLPFLMVTIVRFRIHDSSNENGKVILQFIYCFSIILVYTNSLVSAILFLVMNVKEKKDFCETL